MNRLALLIGVTLSMCCPPPPLQAQVETHNHASIETHNEASLQPIGNPLVFFRETFNWKNAADPKGWTMPANVYLEDPNDTGFNWHWWPNDSLIAISMAEPPFQSTSKEDGHLCLFGAHYQDFELFVNNKPVENSIVFTGIDCSQHSSVILQFETNFMNKGYQGTAAGNWQCLVQVSPDNGFHWTEFNAGFSIEGSGRPDNVAPGKSAHYRINITEMAAGMSNIMVRIKWYSYFGWYFWIIDDLEFCEALPNDLHINYFDIQWDDKILGIDQSFSYMMPLSQIGNGMGLEKFKSGITNMGATEATNIVLDVTIKHEADTVFHEAKTMQSLWPGYKDSLALSGRYNPTEKGRYTVQYRWHQEGVEDNYPEDNLRVFEYVVSDSVYNRAGDQPDYSYSFNSFASIGDDWATPANINHFQGESFPIYADCEVDGISAFITGGLADGLIDFGYEIWISNYAEITTGIFDPRFLMRTERLYLDSAMFNTWVYLPFDKNGEDEFIKAGNPVWAGMVYSNWHPQQNVRRDKGLSIGGSFQTPQHHYRSVFAKPSLSITGTTGRQWIRNSTRNNMIRLHLRNTGISVNPDIYSGNGLVLTQNYPNPFSGQTAINYQIGTDSPVRLEITDLTGRKVLVRDEGPKPPGRHQILIQDAGLAPGVYFYTVYAGANRETKRMMVLDN